MTKRLLFLGPPGAGKGTQAVILSKKNHLLHLSTGDLLRAEVQEKTELGLLAAAVMNSGELVSDSLVLSIVEKKLLNRANEGWLLDGFPRNIAQAEALESLLKKINQPIDCVLLLELGDEVVIKRLLSRGRSDDNEAVIRNRLAVYRQKTAPLIEYYREKDLLLNIPAQGEIESIADRIHKALIDIM